MHTIFRILFWGFNILMLVWLVASLMGGVGEMDPDTMSEAEKAGDGAGIVIVLLIVGVIWLIGNAILGSLVKMSKPKEKPVAVAPSAPSEPTSLTSEQEKALLKKRLAELENE